MIIPAIAEEFAKHRGIIFKSYCFSDEQARLLREIANPLIELRKLDEERNTLNKAKKKFMFRISGKKEDPSTKLLGKEY